MATSETRFYRRFGSTSCCAVCQATSALRVQLQRHLKWAQEPEQWLLSECIEYEWVWIHLKAHVDMCVWCWGLSPARCSCSPWFNRRLVHLMAPDWNAWELQKDLSPLHLGRGMCFDHAVEIPGCYEVQLCRRGVIDEHWAWSAEVRRLARAGEHIPPSYEAALRDMLHCRRPERMLCTTTWSKNVKSAFSSP